MYHASRITQYALHITHQTAHIRYHASHLTSPISQLTSHISHHLPLLFILTLFTLLTFYQSIILPLGEAPDETVHFEVIQFIAQAGHPPTTDAGRAAAGFRGGFAPLYYTLMALPVASIDMSALPELRRLDARPERLIPQDGLSINQVLHTEDESIPGRGVVLAWRIVRWLSIPLGLLTVVLTYAIARLVVPHRRSLAVGAAIFAAFLPRFAINSSVINDDNLATPLAAAVLWLLLKILRGDLRARLFIAVGVTLGLAILTKYYNLILLPEALLALVFAARQGRWSATAVAHRCGLAVLALVLVAGPWFVFIIVRFGRIGELGWIIGLATALGEPQTIGGLRNLVGGVSSEAGAPTFTFGTWLFGLLFRSFWAEFGWMNIFAPAPVYWLFGALTALAMAGLVYALLAHRLVSRDGQGGRVTLWLLLTVHLALFSGVVLLRYLLGQTIDTGQGRHLFPALPAIALFFVTGLAQLKRPVTGKNLAETKNSTGMTRLNVGLGVLLLSVSVGFPIVSVLPVYSPYLPITTNYQFSGPGPQGRLPLSFADGLYLADFKAPPTTTAGDAMPVTLYWYAGREATGDYLVSLCLRNATAQPVACWRGQPVDGRYPMRAWEVGDLIRDNILLPLPACLSPGDYALSLDVSPLPGDSVAAAGPGLQTTLLERIAVAAGAPASGREVWIDGEKVRGTRSLRLRQSITVISYDRPAASLPGSLRATSDTGHLWLPLAGGEVTVTCAEDQTVLISPFMVDYAVAPGRYYLPAMGGGDAPRADGWQVETRPRQIAKIFSSPTAIFADQVALVDYEIGASPRRPGESIVIKLTWQARQSMAEPYLLSLRLLDRTMTAYGARDEWIRDLYPNVLWAPGEVVAQRLSLPVDFDAPPGLYRLELSLLHLHDGGFDFMPATAGDGSASEHLYPATIRILDPAHGSPPPHPFSAQLGDGIRLIGYDLTPSSISNLQSPISLTLYWQSTARIAADYTVFTQLLGPDGQVWAQSDNPPQAGRYPTTAWTQNDTVVDRYTLTIRQSAPPGDYRLLVGMYEFATGQRLPVTANGQPQPDNAIELATLSLAP